MYIYIYVNENTASIFWYTNFKNDLVSQCELISAIILILFLSHSIFRLFMWRLNGAVISQKEEDMERDSPFQNVGTRCENISAEIISLNL